MFDHITGSACANCESNSAGAYGLFCSRGCRDEYDGTGAYAEPDYRPVTRRRAAPVLALEFAPRPHQVDLWEAIADVEAERDNAAPVYGDEFGIIDLFGAGQLVLEVA